MECTVCLGGLICTEFVLVNSPSESVAYAVDKDPWIIFLATCAVDARANREINFLCLGEINPVIVCLCKPRIAHMSMRRSTVAIDKRAVSILGIAVQMFPLQRVERHDNQFVLHIMQVLQKEIFLIGQRDIL